MKKFTKIFAFTLALICIISTFKVNFKAADKFKDENNLCTWQITDETTQVINGMTHKEIYGITHDISGGQESSFEELQHISYMEMKTDGVNSKLVNWGKLNGSKGYTLSSLTSIAKDYEATHPGWIVLGGVNGDQFIFNHGADVTQGQHYFNYQPYYPMKIDGETRFAFTVTGALASQYVGITNDGTANDFVNPSAPKGLRVEVLDADGNITYTHDVNKVNASAGVGEVSLWSSYLDPKNASLYVTVEANTSKTLVLVEEPELAYMYDTPEYNINLGKLKLYGFFGKGEVTSHVKSYTFGGASNNQATYNKLNAFALETDDTEILSKLAVGASIRVEYYWADEKLNEVETFLNYHSCHRVNDKDIVSPQGYDTNHYNRSIWGRKADGTYIFLSAAKGHYEGYQGLTHAEANALLKKLGVVEAYQQDGGGSAMAIVRNGKGGFDLVHPSSDSGGKGERSVLFGCFFVVRSAGIDVDYNESDYHSVSFKKNAKMDFSNFAGAKIEINGNTYDYKDGLKVEGLVPNKEYPVKITSKFGDEEITNTITYTTPEFTFPNNMVELISIGKSEAVFDVNKEEITSVTVHCDGSEFSMNDYHQVVVDELNPEQTYKYTYELTYHDPVADIDLTYESSEFEFTTKAFDVPTFVEGGYTEENGKYEVHFTIKDKDKTVKTVAIYVNGELYKDLKVKSSGEYKEDLENIDVTTSSYSIKFKCTYSYTDDNDKTHDGEVESPEFTIEKVEPIDPPTPPEEKSGCKKEAATLVLSLISLSTGLALVLRKKH